MNDLKLGIPSRGLLGNLGLIFLANLLKVGDIEGALDLGNMWGWHFLSAECIPIETLQVCLVVNIARVDFTKLK